MLTMILGLLIAFQPATVAYTADGIAVVETASGNAYMAYAEANAGHAVVVNGQAIVW